ncbi:hypothetical protein D3C75_1326150 [compost metagenome]
MLAIATHELVQTLLDPLEVFAQSGDHRAQRIAIRPGLQAIAPGPQVQVEVGQLFSVSGATGQ